MSSSWDFGGYLDFYGESFRSCSFRDRPACSLIQSRFPFPPVEAQYDILGDPGGLRAQFETGALFSWNTHPRALIKDDFLMIAADTFVKYLTIIQHYYAKPVFRVRWRFLEDQDNKSLSGKLTRFREYSCNRELFLARAMLELRRRAENLILLLLEGKPPAPRALPLPDDVLWMNNSLYRNIDQTLPIRISGSLPPFLVFYNVETTQAVPTEELSYLYGINLSELLWRDKKYGRISFFQHPAYFEVDYPDAFYSFVDAPNFDVDRTSMLPLDRKPAFILMLQLVQKPPSLRVIRKTPCEVLDWHRIDHLICMGYREYLWVIYSSADAKACLDYALRTWRREYQHKPHLFSQERFKKHRKVGRSLIDRGSFPRIYRPLTPPFSLHIEKDQSGMIEEPVAPDISVGNEELPQCPGNNIVSEDWSQSTKLTSLEGQTEIPGVHAKSFRSPLTIRALGLQSSIGVGVYTSTFTDQREGSEYQTPFSNLRKLHFDNRDLKYNLHSYMKKLFGRESGSPKGTRRMVWTCKCGHTSYDDFNQFPGHEGAVVEFAKELMQAGYITRAQITSQPAVPITRILKRLQDGPTFISLKTRQANPTSLPTFVNSSSLNPSVCLPTQECRWLHLCMKKRPYATHLKPLHVCKDEKQNPLTDETFFKTLKQAYVQEKTWKDWLVFKLKRIDFIGFEACPNDFVDHIKPNDLPPTTNEYDFTPPPPPKMVPPIGPEHMLHLFQNCPSISQLHSNFYLERIPRRKVEPVAFKSHSLDDNRGWGLHFVEGLNTALAITVMFILSSLLGIVFAICWTIFEKDIQGAFGVAAYITSVITLAVMTWQVWSF